MRVLLLLALLAAPALAQDEPDIATQRARLAALQARLDRVGGRDFATTRRIHIDLNKRVIGTWLNAVAPNGLRSVATGTRFEGQLVDTSLPVLGPVTAQLNPASGTRIELIIRNPRVATATDQLTVTGDMTATAQAQARFLVNGMRNTADCRTPAPVRERITATFNLGAPTRTSYPFSLGISRPAGMRAGLSCNISDLKTIDNALPINGLTGELARGNIDIGLSETLRLPGPKGGAPLSVTITPQRPSLRVTAQGVSYAAD